MSGLIEEVVRSQMQEHVMPTVGVFLSEISQEKSTGHTRENKKVSCYAAKFNKTALPLFLILRSH